MTDFIYKSSLQPKLNILFYDIETFPNLGFIWGKWEQNVIEFKKDWVMCSFSYKWQGGKVRNCKLSDYPLYKKDTEDDRELVYDLYDLFLKADIIIAHNGDAFDIKKTNTRFIQNGLKPPPPHKTIDTLKIARKYFKFDSNKLNDLGQYLKLGEKVKTGGFDLWKGCMAGNKESWRLMGKYNNQDVELLEKVYNKLLPWIENHPKKKLMLERPNCDNCDSSKVWQKGYKMNLKGKRRQLHCQSCGHWFSGKQEKIDD